MGVKQAAKEDAGNLLELMHAVAGIITVDGKFINHSWNLWETCNSQAVSLIKQQQYEEANERLLLKPVPDLCYACRSLKTQHGSISLSYQAQKQLKIHPEMSDNRVSPILFQTSGKLHLRHTL